ncbi:MAG: hypothetical protein M5U26_24195 [Planctomycetota bacterium]|nr:hypothetical protein [Planctomycetota bacterium]
MLALTDGDLVVSLSLDASDPSFERLSELAGSLGFAPQNGAAAGVRTFKRSLKPGAKPAFSAQLHDALSERFKAAQAVRIALEGSRRAGALLSAAPPDQPQTWMGGRLAYTGHPLDVALPSPGGRAEYFLPIILDREQVPLGLKAGEVGYVRGGRLFLRDDGYLASAEGPLAPNLAPAAPETERVKIDEDGVVTAYAQGSEPRKLGRMSLARLDRPRGNGVLFASAQPAGSFLAPGEGGAPRLRTGHLEYPALDVEGQARALGEAMAAQRMLSALEAALLEPNDTPRTVSTPSTAPATRAESLAIAADLPLGESHLRALGIKVEATPGRTTLTLGAAEKDRQALVQALSKVLEGLRRKMQIAQQNYDNAFRLRDEQGALNPYRRKLVQIGEAGEILEAEDPNPFIKKLMPEHPDAGPDQNVVFPNINRKVERADYDRARTEHQLIHEVLNRLDPNTIYPLAPLMQLDPDPARR